jgi:hypothetical protein
MPDKDILTLKTKDIGSVWEIDSLNHGDTYGTFVKQKGLSVPYTREERRGRQYEIIEELVNVIRDKGDLNHAICELTALLIAKTGGMGYTNVSEWIDAVNGARKEMERRLLAPYEDMKIIENGDVRSFITLIRQIQPQYHGFRDGKRKGKVIKE